MTGKPLLPPQDDIGLLCMVIANGFTDAVLERLRDGGFGDSKFAHGFVVQGLLAGDRTVTELAGRLGITVQAVSKTVIEMERLGYVQRKRDPSDGRSWVLELSPRGEESLALARSSRLAVQQQLLNALGERAPAVLRALRDLAAEFGGLEALADRRLKPRPQDA